jgi:hypothetical protein
MSEHCVQLQFPLSNNSDSEQDEHGKLFDFEDALSDAISAASVGEFDGNDLGGGECTFYMYGPDADKLFTAIQPVISTYQELVAGGHALLRYGPPEDGIREVKVEIPIA